MPIIKHNGKKYAVNDKGFLIYFSDWDEDWVDYVMQTEGMNELTDDHIKIIDNLRAYHKENGGPPLVRMFSGIVKEPLKRIFELFPSAVSGACKMAGFSSRPC